MCTFSPTIRGTRKKNKSGMTKRNRIPWNMKTRSKLSTVACSYIERPIAPPACIIAVTGSAPCAIANAFTQDPFGGNPATIIFLDPSNTLTQEERLKFANGPDQYRVVFLTPTPTSAEKPGVVSFAVQYFTPDREVELCGHGTIAATKIIFDSATNSPGFGRGSQFPEFCPPETHAIEFTTAKGAVISSRKVVIDDEDWFEIVLPAAKLKKLTDEEVGRVFEILTRAMGKEPRVRYIGMGEPPFQQYLLIVLEESENIEQLKFVDIKALKSTGLRVHVVTTDSTSGKFPEDYITRMFAADAEVNEDPVCGSANSTTGPYWAAQKGITELKVRQVSERGGKLRVGVYGDSVKVRGQVRVTSVGQLFL